MLFHRGLLHSKSITVDQDFSLIGSVNLDMRSFWLNFELTLFVYDHDFTVALRAVQKGYEEGATRLNREELDQRGVRQRFLENTALLVGPLL
jgi:cardiolipin synthase